MQAYRLIPHPASNPREVSGVEVRVKNDDPNWLSLRWRIEGASRLVVPQIASKSRVDSLWQSTCFELFLKPQGGKEYFEWNLSPSRKWNAYSFADYRNGMRKADVSSAPDGVWHGGQSIALFEASIPRIALPDSDCAIALAAVIEEEGGTKSYWSIAHPGTDRPDFHHSACFAATLHPRQWG